MKKSILSLVENLKAKLLQYPSLVNMMEQRDYTFIEKLTEWIEETEEILVGNNISQASELAGLRSKILSPKFSNSRISIRKQQAEIASELLYDIQHTVLQVLKQHEEKVEECRALARQLLSVVNQAGVVTYDDSMEFQTFLDRIWHVITSHNQLKPGAAKLRSLLSQNDTLRLLAEETDLSEWTKDAPNRNLGQEPRPQNAAS